MPKSSNSKHYDLEERSLIFARNTRSFIKKLPRTLSNIEDVRQLVRSSGSIGANYIEANESLSKRDFIMRVKISRKEAKETTFWLNLIECPENSSRDREMLIKESIELRKIFGSILEKSK